MAHITYPTTKGEFRPTYSILVSKNCRDEGPLIGVFAGARLGYQGPGQAGLGPVQSSGHFVLMYCCNENYRENLACNTICLQLENDVQDALVSVPDEERVCKSQDWWNESGTQMSGFHFTK